MPTEHAAEISPSPEVSSQKEGFSSFLGKILNKDVDSLRLSFPLFFLEPISGLEFTSDIGRIDDIAVLASCSLDSGMERMLRVLRTFFSTIAQMYLRRGAKKPLNPILGEKIFIKYVPDSTKLTNRNANDSCTNLQTDFPVFHLVGEQVSHHPPISAYHLCLPNKSISGTMSFYLSAKFNGINVQLKNWSQTTLSISSLDEHYEITYPDAAIVGILTMNFRFLWCGSGTIKCAKSGLAATINFKSQSMFGRDNYSVSGFISNDDNVKLANFSGLWNDSIDLTFTDESGLQDRQPYNLLTINEPSVYTKVVDPNSTARTVWSTVINSMKTNDTNVAKKMKFMIENEQRLLEKQRNNGTAPQFKPAFFEFVSRDSDNSSTTSTIKSRKNSKFNSEFELISGSWKYIGPEIPVLE